MVAQSEAFQKAVVDSKKLLAKPDNDELLEIYALYKIGTGEDFASAAKPGMFDLKGKAKYNAWKALVDDGLTPEEAQAKYAAKVEELKTKYGYDESKVPEAVGGQ
ncbi:putative fatty acid binding protein [Parachaetomium inaequale]|uniref:Fatty acid binding protein n=1 Tax=Parachaetomium inaequale TaxID=2588326 RepID=A0AAN6PJ45_9PEZI|nr:putative fatty acid binding protein [Parachaetomium inaequale]